MPPGAGAAMPRTGRPNCAKGDRRIVDAASLEGAQLTTSLVCV
jgi:hypothetical protein